MTYAQTDYGVATAMAGQTKGALLWCQPRKCWMVYENGVFSPEDREQAWGAAFDAAVTVAHQPGHGLTPAQQNRFCESPNIGRALTQAKRLLSGPDLFDQDPEVLCCGDCVISLRKGEDGRVLDHSPALMMTLTTGIPMRHLAVEGYIRYEGNAAWDQHLKFMTQHLDPEQAEFVQCFQRISGLARRGPRP